MSVPSNLIPVAITGLPNDPAPSDQGFLAYSRAGTTYKVQVADILNYSGVPVTRQVLAGTGLTGGGQLTSNVTLSVAAGGIGPTQLANTGVAAGTYGDASNAVTVGVDAQGRITSITTNPVVISGFVPTSRQVIAGAGLTGGGALTGNVTLSADFSATTPLSVDTTGSAGVANEISRSDHTHPAIDLADDDQVDGLLGLDNGGTARSLVANAGAVVYSGADGLYVGSAGTAGQVLVSSGTSGYTWGTVVILADQPPNVFYAGPTAGAAVAPAFRNIVNTDLPNSGVAANTYGSASSIPVITVNAKGVITSASNQSIVSGVSSVNGQTGAVVLTASDVGAAAITLSGANSDITSMSGVTGGISSPDFIQFDATVTPIPTDATGKIYYDNSDQFQTLSFQMNGNVVQHIGQEQFYRVRCSGSITKGQVVMFAGTLGASGGLIGAAATGLTVDQANYILGVADESGVNNDWIFVSSFGEVKQINTTGGAEAWVQGQILYYNPAVTGGLTKTKPVAPNAIAIVAAVVHVGTSNGILFVRPTFGSVLGGTDGNVQFGTLNAGDIIIYDAVDARWENAAQSALAVGTATNLAGGAASQIPYQTGAGATAFIANGTAGQVLLSAGTSVPTWSGISGGTF